MQALRGLLRAGNYFVRVFQSLQFLMPSMLRAAPGACTLTLAWPAMSGPIPTPFRMRRTPTGDDWALRKAALRNHLQAATACVANIKDLVAIVVKKLFTERYQIKYRVGQTPLK